MALLAPRGAAAAACSCSGRSAPAALSRLPVARRAAAAAAPSRRSSSAVKPAAAATKAATAEEKRWESNVRDGRVKNVSAADAGVMMNEGWTLLDVRPSDEVAKVAIEGAVAVPLFVTDPSNSFGSLVKKATAFGMGGWWLGGTHMIPNEGFIGEVQARIPKDAKVVVGCTKGLRSLAAAEQLCRAGYDAVAWVNGGFDTARKGELPTAGGKDIRFGGIGGLSELLGWTEVQQEQSKGFAGGADNIIKAFVVLLLLDVALFGAEQIAYMTGTKLPF